MKSSSPSVKKYLNERSFSKNFWDWKNFRVLLLFELSKTKMQTIWYYESERRIFKKYFSLKTVWKISWVESTCDLIYETFGASAYPSSSTRWKDEIFQRRNNLTKEIFFKTIRIKFYFFGAWMDSRINKKNRPLRLFCK